jgi:hypothetical protein
MATAHLIRLKIGFLLIAIDNGKAGVRQVRAGYRVGQALEEMGMPRSTPVMTETAEWLEALLNSMLTPEGSLPSTSELSPNSGAKGSGSIFLESGGV